MCFMNSILNELVSIIDSPSFPPISTVSNGIGNFPTMIYANENLKVAFLISELNLIPQSIIMFQERYYDGLEKMDVSL